MARVEIYVGAGIEHGSDRMLFEHIHQLLLDGDGDAILVANTHMKGRQIDLIVARNDLVLVCEAKGYFNPVRGSTNGPWQVRVASGWKSIPNLYRQTINAAYAVRDAMSEFEKTDVAYPTAALVFTPSIPHGSSVESDFKVSVIGLDTIDYDLEKSQARHWTLEQWRAFARHRNLIKVDEAKAACDPHLLASEQLLVTYGTALQRTYAPLAARLVPFECRENGKVLSCLEVAGQCASGSDRLIRGPSGCGKTLLSYRIALDAWDKGRVPIILSAKDFEGKLRDLVHREATLLDLPSAAALVAACQQLGRPITFIVDGYNECAPRRQAELTRHVSVAARRYETGVVIITQIPLEHPSLLPIHEVLAEEPSLAVKRAIAGRDSDDTARNDGFTPLLDSVSTGLEAKLIGEIGTAVSVNASRYALFDRYVRKRLGRDATAGVAALARIAGLLSDRISFSLTARDRDRFAEEQGISSRLLARLHEAHLFVERGERASFSHELFLNVFTAEAVIRRAKGDATAIAEAVSSPRNAGRKALIIGAIDDEQFCLSVLSQVTDAGVILDCAEAQCGAVASQWAEHRCKEMLERVTAEAGQLVFEVNERGLMGIKAEPSSLFQWTRQDEAVLGALSSLVARGRYLDEVLGIARLIDDRLQQEHKRLRPLATEKKVALRSGLFGVCFVRGGIDAPAFEAICGPLHSGMIDRSRSPSLTMRLHEWLAREDLTHGQLYVLLSLLRHFNSDDPSLAPFLPGILQRLWRGSAYHLRLELMQAAHNAAYRISEEDRRNLIGALEDLPEPQNVIDSTMLIDAFKALGVLDDAEREHTKVVRSNIRHAFVDADDPDMQTLAFSVWYGQFDHPYDGAYCEAVNELSSEEKRTLLTMAAKGAELESPFVSILMIELAAYGDPGVAPLLERWRALPPTQCGMRQDALGNYAVAHIALGRLGCPLQPMTPRDPQSHAERSLMACGEILYWMNRVDLAAHLRRKACTEPMQVLSRHEYGVATAIFDEFYRAHSMWSEGLSRLPGEEPVMISICACFSLEVAEIFRECLRHPTLQKGYFDWLESNATFNFAIQGLGEWGNAVDVPLLRVWALAPASAQTALRAIRKLEQTDALAH